MPKMCSCFPTLWLVLAGLLCAVDPDRLTAADIGVGDAAAKTEDIRFPEWAFATVDGSWRKHGMVNVKAAPYNAVGDGVTDDTAAINRAFQEVHSGMIYLPAGTYLVSDSVWWDNWSMRGLHGAGRGKTTIKLKDRAAGFGDRDKPKAVLQTSGAQDGSNSAGSVAFMNSVYFLTVDVGNGNPGATGIDWTVSNDGTLRHVAIRAGEGSGRYGIFYRGESCGLLYDVSVDGFDVGLKADAAGYSNLVGDSVRFTNQRQVVLDTDHEIVDFNNITSVGAVPFINKTSGFGRATYSNISCTYTGKDADATCMLLKEGRILVRNLTTRGFATAISSPQGKQVSKPVAMGKPHTIEFWSAQDIQTGLSPTAATGPLNLPIQIAPEWHSNDFSTWANVADYLAKTGDIAEAMQQAIDSGAQTVFIPPILEAQNALKKTVIVRGKVKRILGYKGFAKNGPSQAFDGPALRIEGGESPVVFIERLHDGELSLDLAAKRTLVVRDANISCGIYAGPRAAGSKLFIENSQGGVFIGAGVTGWIRGLNPYPPKAERLSKDFTAFENQRIVCAGGSLWVLGVFGEGEGALGSVTAGGKLEIYGFNHQSSGKLDGRAAFTCTDASLFAAHWSRHMWNQAFPVLLRETQGGKTQDLNMNWGPFVGARAAR
jgi:hypothetical protein